MFKIKKVTGKIISFFLMCLYTLTVFANTHSIHKLIGSKYPANPQKVAHWMIGFDLSPDNKYFYVLDSQTSKISIAYAVSGKIIKQFPVDKPMDHIIASPSENKLFVGNVEGITVVNVDSGIQHTIDTSNFSKGGISPLLYSPKDDLLYAAEVQTIPEGKPYIYVIDVKTEKIKKAFPQHGTGFAELAFNYNASKLYLLRFLQDKLSVLDTHTYELQDFSLPFVVSGAISALASDPLNNKIYLAGYEYLYVLDATSYKLLGTVKVGEDPMAILPCGNKIYVANMGSHNVSVVDSRTEKVINTISVGFNPQILHLSNDSKKMYVGNSADSSISVIDTASDKVINTVFLTSST